MKKIIFLLSLITVLSIQGQTTIRPIGDSFLDDNINGAYYKDSDDILTKFLGTWQTTWDGKSITIIFEKVTQAQTTNSDGTYYYQDYIVGKFQIVNSNGDIIVPYTNTNSSNLAKLISVGYKSNYKIYILYDDSDFCDISGIICLSLDATNLNSMTYKFQYNDSIIPSDCPYSSFNDIPFPVPTVPVTFAKL